MFTLSSSKTTFRSPSSGIRMNIGLAYDALSSVGESVHTASFTIQFLIIKRLSYLANTFTRWPGARWSPLWTTSPSTQLPASSCICFVTMISVPALVALSPLGAKVMVPYWCSIFATISVSLSIESSMYCPSTPASTTAPWNSLPLTINLSILQSAAGLTYARTMLPSGTHSVVSLSNAPLGALPLRRVSSA